MQQCPHEGMGAFVQVPVQRQRQRHTRAQSCQQTMLLHTSHTCTRDSLSGRRTCKQTAAPRPPQPLLSWATPSTGLPPPLPRPPPPSPPPLRPARAPAAARVRPRRSALARLRARAALLAGSRERAGEGTEPAPEGRRSPLSAAGSRAPSCGSGGQRRWPGGGSPRWVAESRGAGAAAGGPRESLQAAWRGCGPGGAPGSCCWRCPRSASA